MNLGIENMISIESAVAKKSAHWEDKEPMVIILQDGKRVAILTVAQARNIAMDMLQQASRAEADSMIYQFFDKQEYPEGAAIALMGEFREFRLKLDTEWVEKSVSNPSGDSDKTQ